MLNHLISLSTFLIWLADIIRVQFNGFYNRKKVVILQS